MLNQAFLQKKALPLRKKSFYLYLYLYYYNVPVLNLDSPSLPSFCHSTSEVIVAVDLLHKSTIYRSAGVARNNPTAAVCWIRLFPCAPNQSASIVRA
jgi:hypothetical protein